MTIRLTETQLEEQFQEADTEELQFDPSDKLDITQKYGARFFQGWEREIYLREGICLQIKQVHSKDQTIINCLEQRCRHIRFSFTLSGKGQSIIYAKPSNILLSRVAGKYYLRSNGLHPNDINNYASGTWSSVLIDIRPETLCSFVASSEGTLLEGFQHLIRSLSQNVYYRSGNTQPLMFMVLQQLMNCPYQGLVKRAYLESKAIELVALVLDHEITIQQGKTKKSSLRSEQMERIHYAKEILLKDLENPPSIAELAHLVGLNEGLLKRGFRQTFGTTVFDTLQSYRLDIARQLLAEQDISIVEVAQHAGYGSATTFGRAFRKKFGVSPKQYQKICR